MLNYHQINEILHLMQLYRDWFFDLIPTHYGEIFNFEAFVEYSNIMYDLLMLAENVKADDYTVKDFKAHTKAIYKSLLIFDKDYHKEDDYTLGYYSYNFINYIGSRLQLTDNEKAEAENSIYEEMTKNV